MKRTSANRKQTLSLQPMPQAASQRRSIRAARSGGTAADDPIIQALDEYRAVMVRILEERGPDNLKDPTATTIDDDLKALDKIRETVPRTLYGVLHLAKFVRNTMQDQVDIVEYQAALQDNLISALERIAGRPAPEVAPYSY